MVFSSLMVWFDHSGLPACARRLMIRDLEKLAHPQVASPLQTRASFAAGMVAPGARLFWVEPVAILNIAMKCSLDTHWPRPKGEMPSFH